MDCYDKDIECMDGNGTKVLPLHFNLLDYLVL